MLLTIGFVLFAIGLVCWAFDEPDVKWSCVLYVIAFIAVLIGRYVTFEVIDSPIRAATDKKVDVAEMNLAMIQDNNEDNCYVLKNSQNLYYFVTVENDRYGIGNDDYEANIIDAEKVIVTIIETDDVTKPYVDIDDVDARITLESLGIKPIKSYKFVVPKGSIRYADEFPN